MKQVTFSSIWDALWSFQQLPVEWGALFHIAFAFVIILWVSIFNLILLNFLPKKSVKMTDAEVMNTGLKIFWGRPVMLLLFTNPLTYLFSSEKKMKDKGIGGILFWGSVEEEVMNRYLPLFVLLPLFGFPLLSTVWWIGAITMSVIFAYLHVRPDWSLIQKFIYYPIMGVTFTVIMLKCGLIPTIIAHCTVNLVMIFGTQK